MASRKNTVRKPRRLNAWLGNLEGIGLSGSSEAAIVPFNSRQALAPGQVGRDIERLSKILGVRPDESVKAAVAEDIWAEGLDLLDRALASGNSAQLSQAVQSICHLVQDQWDQVRGDLRAQWIEYSKPLFRLIQDPDLRENLGFLIVEKSSDPTMEVWLDAVFLICSGERQLRDGEIQNAIKSFRLATLQGEDALEVREAALSGLIECFRISGQEIEYRKALLEWRSLFEETGSIAAQIANIDIKGAGRSYLSAKSKRTRQVVSDLAMELEKMDDREGANDVLSDCCGFGLGEWSDDRHLWAGTFDERRRHGSLGLDSDDPSIDEKAPINLIPFARFGPYSGNGELSRVLGRAFGGPAGQVNAIMLGPMEYREISYPSERDVTPEYFGEHLSQTMTEMVGDAFRVQVRQVHDNGSSTSMVVVTHNLKVRRLRGVSLVVEPIQINSMVELAVSAVVFPDRRPSENERQRLTEILSTKTEVLPGFMAFSEQAMDAIREAGRRLQGDPETSN